MQRGSLFGAVLLIAVGAAGAVMAQTGDAARGKPIYEKRCALCHGVEGDGQGPGAERLNPPPRDFTEGQYKFKTTGFDDIVPHDRDLFLMMRDGMPGTAMPGWEDILSEQDGWDLVAYLKTFAGLEEEKPGKQVDYATQIATSDESIAAGRKLFLDRCGECHGDEGKGDAIKKLKDDAGNRTWPRNLTKPWTFRVSNDPKDIFTRITVGIPSTQMPSFVDPKSKKKMTAEERWHVANYVATLAKTEKVVRPEKTVIKAAKVEGGVPDAPDDPRWAKAEAATFFLLPQFIAKQRFFTPSNDTITVRAVYGDKDLALLLEWDDRTRSVPGDPKAAEIADKGFGEDMVAVQLPVAIPGKGEMEKPYFLMGDATHPVNLWQWRSGAAKTAESGGLANARGPDKVEARDAAKAGLSVKGAYKNGAWRVVMRRPLQTGDGKNDIQFREGAFIPIAFAAWDGSNGEVGSRHTITTWYWLQLEPPAGMGPYLAAILVFLVIGAGEFWWARSAAAKPAAGEA